MTYQKLLVTAFEPFDSTGINSALKVLRRLELPWLKTAVLPVSYRRAPEALSTLIDKERPDFVVSLGQAGGETTVRLEKVALNYTRASVPDNDGVLLRCGAVVPDAPEAIFTGVEIETLVERLSAAHDVKLSLSAGSYVCNAVYYTALYRNSARALFVHLPYCHGQGEPSVPTEEMASTVRALLTLLHTPATPEL